MPGWIVSKGQSQFEARDLAELKQMAQGRRFGQYDLVRPPGSNEWLYAFEVPDLKAELKKAGPSAEEMEMEMRAQGGGGVPTAAIAGVLALIAAGGAFMAWNYANSLPEVGDLELLGAKGLALTQVVTTSDATLLDKAGGSTIASLPKDTTLSLLGKRHEWYHVRTEAGQEGYTKADQVIPAYFFADPKTKLDYDPLYNPDKYVSVSNASWVQVDQDDTQLTVFQFAITNESKFQMTDLVLQATIKDKNGNELEKLEFPVEGIIPRGDSVSVGTLAGEKDEDPKRSLTSATFAEESKVNPDLNLRWSDGVEVLMQAKGFDSARIDLIEVRAIPNE